MNFRKIVPSNLLHMYNIEFGHMSYVVLWRSQVIKITTITSVFIIYMRISQKTDIRGKRNVRILKTTSHIQGCRQEKTLPCSMFRRMQAVLQEAALRTRGSMISCSNTIIEHCFFKDPLGVFGQEKRSFTISLVLLVQDWHLNFTDDVSWTATKLFPTRSEQLKAVLTAKFGWSIYFVIYPRGTIYFSC